MPHDHHDHLSPSGHPYRPDNDMHLSYWQQMEIAVRELLIEKGVTEEELADAKNSLLSSVVYLKDDQMRRARIYGVALTTGQTVKDIEEWPSRIEAVTTKQVQDVARRYLQAKRSVTGILLPGKMEHRAKAFGAAKKGKKS